jgi:PAS domain S-box-containing protein
MLAQPRSAQADAERLQFWLQSSPDWLWEVDAEGCYTYVSPRCQTLLGYGAEQLLGVHWSLILLNFESCEQLQLRLNRAESFSQDLTCLHLLGYSVTLEITATPIWQEEGFAGFRGISRDISARQHATRVLQDVAVVPGGEMGDFFGRLTQGIQAALAIDSQQALTQMEQANQLLVARISQRTLALRESEGRFQQMFEQSPIGLAILTLDGVIDRVNPAFAELVAPSLDPIDRSLLALNQGHDPFRGGCPMTLLAIDDDRLSDQVHQWLDRPETSLSQELRYGPESQQSWGLLTLQLLRDVARQPAAILLIVQDIDDRKQLEAQQARLIDGLALVNQQLARATQLKDEFLASMSHELRTPLNSILGLSEGLCQQVYGDLTPRQLRSLQTIDRNGQHLLSLINDILDLAKIEAGKLDLTYGWVSVRGICELSLGVVAPLALRKSIAIHLEAEDSDRQLGRFWADERRIQQILVNLLDNAIKFTPEGGQVILRAEAGDDQLSFEVQDNGGGIEPELLATLFDPFVQAQQGMARSGGTGLGLALVKRLAHLHGGTATVESQLGQGSCFRIELPRQEPQPAD